STPVAEQSPVPEPDRAEPTAGGGPFAAGAPGYEAPTPLLPFAPWLSEPFAPLLLPPVLPPLLPPVLPPLLPPVLPPLPPIGPLGPLAAPSAVPSATPPPGCSIGATCHVLLAATFAPAPILVGPCPRPIVNCVELTTTGSFTVLGTIRGLAPG